MNESPQLPPHYELVELSSVDSVVGEAIRRACDGAEEGTLVWAGEQSDARTRNGGRWFSPQGNLHCSLILRPEFSNASGGQLAYVAALAAGSALAELLSPMTGLRYGWPGDLYINELKAGQFVIAAPGAYTDPYEWLVLGTMINIEHHPPNPEPEEFNSVHSSGAPEVTVAQTLENFARYFLHWINRWAEDGFEPIRRQWQIRAEGVGESVDIHIADETLSGTFVEVDEEGRLVMRQSGEAERRISVNEYFGLKDE